jgi:hypothetical protein
MSNIINFIFIEISDNILASTKNNLVYINVYTADNKTITFSDQVQINYNFNNYLVIKEYFIETTYYNYYSTPLTTSNFYIEINDPSINYNYIYSVNTIYFYRQNIVIPFTMLGLINYNNTISLIVNYSSQEFGSNFATNNKIVNLKNFFINNRNTLQVSGTTTQIFDMTLTNSSDDTITYNFFSTIFPSNVNNLFKIYFYDPTFVYINNISNKNNTYAINFLIEIYNNRKKIYSYLINLNSNYIDNSSNSYDVIFFKNQISNVDYTKIVLRVFDYDYYNYFSSLLVSDYVGCEQITLDKANLYYILIANNNNIPKTVILNLNINDYNINVSYIQLKSILLFNTNAENLTARFLQSNKILFELLVDYLINFKIKNYNFYSLNIFKIPVNNEYQTVNNLNTLNNYTKDNLILNFNNFYLNGILINIEILYYDKLKQIQIFNIYGMIFNNNNIWDIYTKKINLNSNNKTKLIEQMTIMLLNYFQINVYIYNNIDDLNNNIKIKLLNSNIVNPFYFYNKMILDKKNSSLGYNLEDNYLKFIFNINLDYKLLIFQLPITFTEDILTFQTSSTNIFKIFKIFPPNYNNYQNNIYSLFFQNTNEVTSFMNYIQYGVLKKPLNSVSYYNIITSLYFKKNLIGFYQITNNITENNLLYFSIINLNLTTNNIFYNNYINIT